MGDIKDFFTASGTLPLPEVPDRAADSWPEPLPVEQMYGPVGDFVRLLAPESEADPMALYVQTLAACGSIIGRNAYCKVRDTRHHPNLFVGNVGITANGRKGLGGDSVRALAECVDSDWAANCVVSGLSSGEYIIARLKDADPDKDEKEGDGTFGTVKPVKDRRLLIFEDELGFLLSSAKRDSSTSAAVLRTAWDGVHRLQVAAKNTGGVATDAHISLIGHITREELMALLTDTMLKGGLVNRFLWICSKRSKLLPHGGKPLDYSEVGTKLAAFPRDGGQINRDADADKLWESVYNEIESLPRDGMFAKATCRGSAQTLRLSLIFALLDGERIIRVPHLEAALDVWRFSEASARFIFQRFTGNVDEEKVLAALLEGPKTLTEVNDLFGGNRSKEFLATLRESLLKTRRITIGEAKPNGRKVEVWIRKA
jgi:uncharacterized protein DUF3987